MGMHYPKNSFSEGFGPIMGEDTKEKEGQTDVQSW